MITEMTCPICGTTNSRTYYTETFGLCEDYYNCHECGYFSHMCYSPVYEGICVPEGKTEEEIKEIYGKEIEERNLSFIPPDHLP